MANNTGRGFIARSAHRHALFRLWQAALAFQAHEKLDVDISKSASASVLYMHDAFAIYLFKFFKKPHKQCDEQAEMLTGRLSTQKEQSNRASSMEGSSRSCQHKTSLLVMVGTYTCYSCLQT